MRGKWERGDGGGSGSSGNRKGGKLWMDKLFRPSLDDCRRQRGHGNEQAEVATGEGGTAQCGRCQATEKGDRLNTKVS